MVVDKPVGQYFANDTVCGINSRFYKYLWEFVGGSGQADKLFAAIAGWRVLKLLVTDIAECQFSDRLGRADGKFPVNICYNTFGAVVDSYVYKCKCIAGFEINNTSFNLITLCKTLYCSDVKEKKQEWK